VSLGTVKSRIMRGRESLRKILEGRIETSRQESEAPVRWSSEPVTE
jgi:hypothetical protein